MPVDSCSLNSLYSSLLFQNGNAEEEPTYTQCRVHIEAAINAKGTTDGAEEPNQMNLGNLTWSDIISNISNQIFIGCHDYFDWAIVDKSSIIRPLIKVPSVLTSSRNKSSRCSGSRAGSDYIRSSRATHQSSSGSNWHRWANGQLPTSALLFFSLVICYHF